LYPGELSRDSARGTNGNQGQIGTNRDIWAAKNPRGRCYGKIRPGRFEDKVKRAGGTPALRKPVVCQEMHGGCVAAGAVPRRRSRRKQPHLLRVASFCNDICRGVGGAVGSLRWCDHAGAHRRVEIFNGQWFFQRFWAWRKSLGGASAESKELTASRASLLTLASNLHTRCHSPQGGAISRRRRNPCRPRNRSRGPSI